MSTNAGSTMLPLHSLLNPTVPVPAVCPPRRPSSTLSCSSTPVDKEPLQATMDRMLPSRSKTSKGLDNPTMPRPQGPVNFAPFEDVDEASVQELSRFRVRPFGQIRQSCEHIPYNSSKKDFFEKTGRESMEVFKYQFQIPEDDNCYTVMWDYNVGLVRMTPFFKSLGYAKTKPSQMLDKNPGLRDITPSVTGGAVTAQGYWMPYRCARAVCATFCYCIAGALIPLFGPCFPSECTPPESSYFREMVISQDTIADVTREVEFYRQAHKERIPRALSGAAHHGQLEFRGKHMSDIDPVLRTPSLHPQPYWAPINSTEADHPRPNYYPQITGHEAWGRRAVSRSELASSFASGPSTEREPIQRIDPLLNSVPQMASEQTPRFFTDTWRPKRRRRVHAGLTERGQTVAPDTDMRGLAKKPEQDLDKFKAAAVLVSLHKEMLNQQNPDTWSATAVVESSDDDESSGGAGVRHQKKRPKAHSF
ncbi:hypothetical protein PT974_00816 [Cladobotryum mycophilum]|uniref:HTH APSES-type domain-containing protein n=1 Tax=Cladobotryum mycophilum TaxID=491253 RepID=A0ABR0T240_9HYPO